MKIFIDAETNKENGDYMEFDIDTMYCKTRNNGVINYEKFTNKQLATALYKIADAFFKKGD